MDRTHRFDFLSPYNTNKTGFLVMQTFLLDLWCNSLPVIKPRHDRIMQHLFVLVTSVLYYKASLSRSMNWPYWVGCLFSRMPFLFFLLFALFWYFSIIVRAFTYNIGASIVFHSEFAGLRETAKNLGLGDSIEVQLNRCGIFTNFNQWRFRIKGP